MVAEGIVNLALQIQENSPSTKIIVSGLLPRSNQDLNTKIKEINKLLLPLCDAHDWTFLQHSNINEDSLNRSGLHLNHKGTSHLAQNFLNVLDLH